MWSSHLQTPTSQFIDQRKKRVMKLDISYTILKSSLKGRTTTIALSVAETVSSNCFKTGVMLNSEKRHAIVREARNWFNDYPKNSAQSHRSIQDTDRFRFLALRIQQLRINHIFRMGEDAECYFDFLHALSTVCVFGVVPAWWNTGVGILSRKFGGRRFSNMHYPVHRDLVAGINAQRDRPRLCRGQ